MIRRLLLPGLLAASLGTLGAAQSICHAENDGPNFNDLVSTGGPNLLIGVRFVAPASFTCSAIEVFTGEGFGTNSVAIWSHDNVNNEPNTQSGVGTWSMSGANSWQGASLGTPVALTGGTTYWMVWGCINNSQAPVDVPMATLGQVYRGSFDNGASWSGPFQFNDRHWKFRLYGNCNGVGTQVCFGIPGAAPCPCGNPDPTGMGGCANSTGVGCVLTGSGSNSIAADDLVLSAAHALPNQPGIFFQGDVVINGGNGAPFGDGLRCTGQNVVRLQVVVPDANGDASSSDDIADEGGVAVGNLRHYQYWYRDPVGGPCGTGFNLSNALSVTWAP